MISFLSFFFLVREQQIWRFTTTKKERDGERESLSIFSMSEQQSWQQQNYNFS